MNNTSSNRLFSNKSTFNRLRNTIRTTAATTTFTTIMVIVLVLVLILVIYFVYRSNTNDYSAMNPVLLDIPTNAFSQDAKGIVKKIPANTNPFSYSYSMWIYVSEWNERNKFILEKSTDNNTVFSPSIRIGSGTNDLIATISTTASTGQEQCNVPNIPLQKWCHIVYVLNNRTVDIYINGKLERSCVLQGIPLARTSQDVSIVPNGGFYGQISRVQYFSSSLQPTDVEKIYLDGPYDGRKYDIKFFEQGNIVNINQRY